MQKDTSTAAGDATRTGVTRLTIDADTEGQRIDNFLKKHLKDVPMGHVYRIIRSGQVRVNGGRVKPTRKLVKGDELRLPPLLRHSNGDPAIPGGVQQRLEEAIVFEDDELIVLAKPDGLAVHAGSNLPFGIIEALRVSRNESRMELIHRLDRDTSGCLMIGKTLTATRHYQDMFRQRQVDKTYRALVTGRWQVDSKEVSNKLVTNRVIGGERMVVVDEAGKEAQSCFSTLRTLPAATEMAITIATGRTHQIRVHAAGCGHPVVGDRKYGDNAHNKKFHKLGLKRLFLHAERLVLADGRKFEVEPGTQWEDDLARLGSG